MAKLSDKIIQDVIEHIGEQTQPTITTTSGVLPIRVVLSRHVKQPTLLLSPDGYRNLLCMIEEHSFREHLFYLSWLLENLGGKKDE